MTDAEEQELARRAVKDDIRNRGSEGYLWEEGFEKAKTPLKDLQSAVDLQSLSRVAETAQRNHTVNITFVSKEYLSVGLNWMRAMDRLGLSNTLIVAGDLETGRVLRDLNVFHVEADIDTGQIPSDYRSPADFTAKGLAINTLKFPIVRSLLKQGYDVIMSDADAIWLRDPMSHFPSHIDIAFQRVAVFPRSIVVSWGFAACSGFVFFRSSSRTIAFLDDCISEHTKVQSDQLALNLALLEADVRWNHPAPDESEKHRRGSGLSMEIKAAFAKAARTPIQGQTDRYGLQVLALPHHEFWRHRYVPCERSELVVSHPNSPKDGLEKIRILDELDLLF